MFFAPVEVARAVRALLGIFAGALLIFGTLCTFHFDLLIIESSDRIFTDVSGNNHFLPTGSALVREGELIHDFFSHLPLIGAGLAFIGHVHNSFRFTVGANDNTL